MGHTGSADLFPLKLVPCQCGQVEGPTAKVGGLCRRGLQGEQVGASENSTALSGRIPQRHQPTTKPETMWEAMGLLHYL
jgi:hypothetical protein